jgi:predicted LPLAT superfamily acyltransferase
MSSVSPEFEEPIRKPDAGPADPGDWSARPEGGGRFALTLIAKFALWFGRVPARLALYPITLYFYIRRAPERRASHAYLGRVLGRPAGALDVIRHMHCFAATILDRVFLLGERFKRFRIELHGIEQLVQALDHKRGVLLLGSHFGSFEALRVLSLQRPDVPLRVLLDTGHNATITSLLHALNPELARSVIDARQDGPAILFAIKDALDRQALVTLLADRPRPGEPTAVAPFLGEAAAFPAAPWLIASACGVPVVLCFGVYRGGNRYDLHFELFQERVEVPRRERRVALTALVERYAARLEHHVRRAPLNWFNFYDFWQSERDRVAADRAGTGRA